MDRRRNERSIPRGEGMRGGRIREGWGGGGGVRENKKVGENEESAGDVGGRD